MLRARFLHEEQIVIEGRFAVSRALQCGYRPDTILTTQDTLHTFTDLPLETTVEVLSRQDLSQVSGYDFHRGCLALGRRPQPVNTVSAMLDRLRPDRGDVIDRTMLLLERVTDPQNLGAIVRTAHALGVDPIFVSRDCADPWSRRVIRTSMANVFATPPVIVDDLCEVADRLATEAHVPLVAAALTDDAVSIDTFERGQGPLALMLGNEGAGLSASLLNRALTTVKIPVRGVSDSLNVAVAAGIFMDRLRPQTDLDTST
jgi:tRNA G18 (ribose-2'-O)-methylase SpoU